CLWPSASRYLRRLPCDQVRQLSPLPCARCSGVLGGSERPRKKALTPRAMTPMLTAKPIHCETLAICPSEFPGGQSPANRGICLSSNRHTLSLIVRTRLLLLQGIHSVVEPDFRCSGV